MYGGEMMKKFAIFCVLILAASAVVAHPHFQMSVTATLAEDSEASVAFMTVPANMTHAESADNGAFLAPGMPKLTLSADVKAGSVSIPAGTYTVGAIKNSMDDWTMALSPGELERGATPDASKLIKLDSEYVKLPEPGGHLWVYIGPGEGKFDGKATIAMGFGTMVLTGALNDAE
jgi:hypothetical protein